MSNPQESALIEEGALPPDDFHDDIERIQEIAEYDLETPAGFKTRLSQHASHLLVNERLLGEAAAALRVGHLVLQGPPGTGKSSLARALCRAFHCSVFPVTAHEDWSVFEVIGRQELRIGDGGDEEVVPVNGFFTEAVIRCAGTIVKHFDNPEAPQAEWLLIDELNRAHLDKAFGELFTLLGTDETVPITLPHQHEGNRELVAPRRFRIIATLNSIDKQFVNSLSQGLKRRFTFITVDIPPPLGAGETLGMDTPGASLASREFTTAINRAAERMSRRSADADDVRRRELEAEYSALLLGGGREALEHLFGLASSVRYVAKDSDNPHLPIGTAQLIDTIELFLSKILMEGLEDGGAEGEDVEEIDYLQIIDWAAAVKLAPLFDADTINPAGLEQFAESLSAPFNGLMRRELLQIVAAGSYYVGQ